MITDTYKIPFDCVEQFKHEFLSTWFIGEPILCRWHKLDDDTHACFSVAFDSVFDVTTGYNIAYRHGNKMKARRDYEVV